MVLPHLHESVNFENTVVIDIQRECWGCCVKVWWSCVPVHWSSAATAKTGAVFCRDSEMQFTCKTAQHSGSKYKVVVIANRKKCRNAHRLGLKQKN